MIDLNHIKLLAFIDQLFFINLELLPFFLIFKYRVFVVVIIKKIIFCYQFIK